MTALPESSTLVARTDPERQKVSDRPAVTSRKASVARNSVRSIHASGAGIFVGRSAELKVLRAGLADALNGSLAVTLLVGEPGIGKTRTAGELAASAARRGVRVLSGTCTENEQTPAYGPWALALGGYARSAPADELPAIAGPGAEEVLSLVPELRRKTRSPGERTSRPPSDARPWMFERLATCLDALAGTSGLLVLLDNIQWADPDSLRFLEYVVRERPRSPIMILCTARDYELTLDHPLSRSLGEIVKLPSFRRVRLEGLTIAEVGLYLRRSLGRRASRALAGDLHLRSGGNPLFMRELVRAARDRPRPVDGEPAVPTGIRDAIGRRFFRLPADCRAALSLASVIGRSFAMVILRRLETRAVAARLPELLREAAGQGFVEQRAADGTSWQFTHALVQETLYDALPADRRAELHGQIADAIETLRGTAAARSVEELFRHRLGAIPACGARGVARAATLCVRRARERSAPELAVQVLTPAIEAVRAAAPSAARQREAAALLHLLGQAYDDLGDPRSREALQQSFDLSAALGDTRRAIEVALSPSHWRDTIGSLDLTMSGTIIRSIRDRALALAKRGSRDELQLLTLSWDARVLRRALAEARKRGEKDIEFQALIRLACKVDDEEYGTGAPLWGQAMRMRGRFSDALSLHSLLLFSVVPQAALGDLDGARATVREMLQNAERARSRRYLWEALQSAAMVEGAAGEWEAARQHVSACLATPSNNQPVLSRVFCLFYRATVEAETGNEEDLRKCLRDVADMTGKVDPTFPLLAARRACISGDTRDLEEIARTVPSPDDPMSPYGWFETAWRVAAATLAILREDRDAALSQEEYFRARKGLYLLPGPGGRCCDGVLAQLCACGGRLDEAIGHFEDAIAFCRRSGFWPELAWTQRYAAEALVRRSRPGDSTWARRLLDEGETLARSLSMRPLLSQMGAVRRSPRALRPTLAPLLTARELEVVRLVAGGLTNREIGAKLSMSEHTAAKHVQNILVKTGMSNRAEVSAFAVSRGLLGDR
jgi:DNA-binding CsgD family transcriptional regulator/tetratricopeptide (TPR) repeat protein